MAVLQVFCKFFLFLFCKSKLYNYLCVAKPKDMYQIAISSTTTNKEVRFSFDSKKEAKDYIKMQATRKGMTLHYGIAYNNTIELRPLF